MKRLLLVFTMALAAACGGGDDGGGGSGLSVGQICSRIGDALCEELEACELAVENCRDVWQASCCDDEGACGQETNTTGDDVSNCTDDIHSATCEDFEGEIQIPQSCLNL